ncbi:putative lytic transglycosylase, catalytic [Magnetofaba australis IT-1]|uniref:Membrane-bound lytic murein transglycosylase F n=1 Tax=Magnetofaba australis IT-1 TaxID=1434232 RepID=A0A1Y2K5Z3_9PROT|nr:putative lytic transglycosylase, catalytic [Magnetofaba australis IT-1]
MDVPLLDQIRQEGVLRVLTRNAPTVYFQGRDREMGFEHDLAMLFAQELGVRAEFVVHHNSADVLNGLRNGQGHLAAAGLERTEEGTQAFLYGPVYQNVDLEVVCRRGGVRPENLIELSRANLVVGAGGGYEARLLELRALAPQLDWIALEDLSTEQILQLVEAGKYDCTIASSNIVAINRRYYPELVVKFPLDAGNALAWALPKRAVFLQRELQRWFEKIRANGQFDDVFERYYGYMTLEPEDYDYVDNRSFVQRIESRLPQYERWFKKAGRRYRIPWRLLAAQSYQESHWNPEAKSPTGVRGIMMLTRVTAKALGVSNRLDPKQSIMGGARYLANMRRRLPSEITEPDRTWIALAAYNVGLGHVIDARTLAKRKGLNHNEWPALREVLPLLAQRKYYRTLKRGYARGIEPVLYVRKIRHYRDILEKLDGGGIAPTPPQTVISNSPSAASVDAMRTSMATGQGLQHQQQGSEGGLSGQNGSVSSPMRETSLAVETRAEPQPRMAEKPRPAPRPKKRQSNR